MTETWLARFYEAATLLWPEDTQIHHDEMSPEVFAALVDGRIGEVSDLLEDMPETAGEPTPVIEMRSSAVALATLLRSLSDPDAPFLMTETGAITVLVCKPAAMRDDMIWAARSLIRMRVGETPDFLLFPTEADGTKAVRRAMQILQVLAATDRPQIVVQGPDDHVPAAMAALLPAPVTVGPPDRETLAAALSLVPADDPASVGEVPADAALRAVGWDGIRLALRFSDRARIVSELRRMADRSSAPSGRVTLDDIAGYGHAEEVSRRLVKDLAAWSRGEIPWSDMTRSVLFHGEPGTGKTFMARAIAGSAGVPLVTGSLAQWQSHGHLGDLLREMRRTFAQASEAAPAILFIDEIDAAGDRGGKDKHAENYRRQVINGLLELMDGALRMEGVILLAACNDRQALDPALTRPGRIDTIVRVPSPGLEATGRILAYHLRGSIPSGEITALARRSVALSAAELDGAVREARSRARNDGVPLSARYVIAALGVGAEDKDMLWRFAVHEAGHAIAALRLGRGRVARIFIGMSGGRVVMDGQPRFISAQDVRDQIVCYLAGRAAEELLIGDGSPGAGGAPGSDLAMASSLALKVELTWGLTDQGLLYHPGADDMAVTSAEVRERAGARLRDGMVVARQILTEERDRVLWLAARLVRDRVLEKPAGKAMEDWFMDDAGCPKTSTPSQDGV